MPSPFPEDLKSVQLRVSAGSPLAEIFLVNHAFTLLKRSIEYLEAEVEPGVYKIKATLGEATTEELILLDRDMEVDLSDELALASPAPLPDAALTHEFHVIIAGEQSVNVDESPGSGAEILIVTRRWSSEGPDDAPKQYPLAEPTLRTPDGETLVDLTAAAARASADWDPVAGMTVRVDPGTYFLRWTDESGVTAEQTLVAVPSWQTQVFVLEQGSIPDLPSQYEVSVQMSQYGFNPDDEMTRRVEEARSALADERRVASEQISESLFAKFDSPMLGLYGAHLMLIAQEAMEQADQVRIRGTPDAKPMPAPVAFNQSLFDTVVENLRGLLGVDHPDVIALSTKTSDPGFLAPIAAPPMLWRSWLLLLEASNASPHVVPLEVYRRTLTLLPMRPFLVWSPADDEQDAVKQWKDAMSDTVKRAAKATGTAGEARRELGRQLLAPASAIDDLLGGPES